MKTFAIRSVILGTVISLLAAFLAAGVAGEEQGLVNPGFESGTLEPWEIGFSQGADTVTVLKTDTFASTVRYGATPGPVTVLPRYGDWMAKVGKSSSGSVGTVELQQDFVVPGGGVAQFAYKLCTYDGLGSDHFAYRVAIMDGETEVEVPGYEWTAVPVDNPDEDYWCSDWTDVTVALSDYADSVARVKFTTNDAEDGLATWAYVDAPLPAVVPEPEPEPDPEGDAVGAIVDVKPETLNLGAAEGDGALTVFLELPAGLSLNDVDSDSVVLSVNGSEFRPDSTGNGFGDYDGDGVPDRMFKFRRAAIVAAVGSASDSVTFTLAGEVDGVPFAGLDTVRVLQNSALANRANGRAR